MESDERCTIRGYLYGVVCEKLSIRDPAVGAELIVVPSRQAKPSGDPVKLAAGAQERKAFVRRAEEDELNSAADGLVLRGRVAKDGSFCLSEPRYEGGLVDVYAVVDRVPLPKHERAEMPLPEPQRLFLGTYDPARSEDGFLLGLLIPQHVWCGFKRKADAWTIVGRVGVCDDLTVPIGGVTVAAFDTDIVEHDPLGTDVTSSGGLFRIDYPGDAYRQGTFIDVELFGGPDVWFKIEDADGNVLLDEGPDRGRTSGRCDSGPCLCVELCVDVPVPSTVIPSVWTGIGTAFTIPDGSGLNDFDDEGYVGAAKYGFTGTIRMTGSAALRTGGNNPIEYRVLVSGTSAPNSGPPPGAGDFTRIVGVSPDDNLFAPTKVGQMIRFTPFKVVDIDVKLTDLDPDGWLDVNKCIERVFIERPDVDPVDIPNFLYVDLDGLMAINTVPLTLEPNPPVGTPGDPVAAGDLIGIEKVAIRFEVREVVDKPNGIFNALPGSGTTLNAMVVNNNPTYLRLAMTEHLTTAPCAVLSGPVHAAYTAHHPHLQGLNLGLTSNDGVYNVSLSDPPELPLAGNTNAAIVQKNNSALAVPATDPQGDPLKKCTYLVTLSAIRRLHTGDGAVSGETVQTTFYYEP